MPRFAANLSMMFNEWSFLDRFAAVTRRFDTAVEIAGPTPALAARLAATGRIGRLFRLDWTAASRPDAVGDEERLPLAPESIDLAVSVLALHFANDLPGVLAQLRRALRPDGLFLAALLGGETLTELRQSLAEAEVEITGGAAPRVAPFAELRTLGGLLQRAGFALPVIDQDRVIVRYANALELMRDTTRAHGHREDADYAFHIAIAEAANNYFFLSSMQALKDHINVGMKLHGLSLLGPAGGLVGVLDEHDAIFAAIRDRKEVEARDAMRRHIQGSYDRLFEGKVLDLSL